MDEISEERSRIARELHDGIAQDLAAIGYRLDGEIGRSDTHPQSREALRAIRAQLTEVNSQVRKEIFRLRSPRELSPQIQLESALKSLHLLFTITGRLPEGDLGSTLFKVLLELARNAREHSKAEQISIEITSERILMKSDGVDSGKELGEGFGLIGIAERLAECGWRLQAPTVFSRIEIVQEP